MNAAVLKMVTDAVFAVNADELGKLKALVDLPEQVQPASKAAVRAMRAISKLDLTERVLLDVIAAAQAMLARSNWVHTGHAIQADEALTDAHFVIELAAEEMENESAYEESERISTFGGAT